MPRVKFSNIILERNASSADYPSLYCRSSSTWLDSDDGGYTLVGPGTFDFTTYFNALSVQKLRRYAGVTSSSLSLEARGASFTIVQTHADALADSPVERGDSAVRVASSEDWQPLNLGLLCDDTDVLIGFKVIAEGNLQLRNASYVVEVDHELRDVKLLLSTTTFKKEAYITKNIQLVREQILDSDDDIANNFAMLVVDNGRTLDAQALSGGGVTVQPNANVGGAGGFTRGMIYALESDEGFTNILLMDDDVLVSPESIKRTYNLLRIANDEYAKAFVSGSMLAADAGDTQWEDTGYVTSIGTFHPAKPVLSLTKFEDIVYNEAFHVTGEAKNLNQRYAAWWFCCMPLEVIRRNGLPLPYFVRCDDAEYGTRCAPKFMTMNGLCVWHDSFHKRYNAAVERYNMTRNVLIAQFTTGFASNSDVMPEVKKSFYLELKKFGYENAALILDALEDFMKGPDFYSAKGVAEKTFMDANRNKEKLYPLGKVAEMAIKIGINDFDLTAVDRQLIDGDKPRSLPQRLTDFATDNNQRLIVNGGKGYAVIPNVGWAYPAGAIRGKKYLIVVDWCNRVGTIRVKDVSRYQELSKRFKADMKEFNSRRKELEQAYSASRKRITSMEFWKDYLDL